MLARPTLRAGRSSISRLRWYSQCLGCATEFQETQVDKPGYKKPFRDSRVSAVAAATDQNFKKLLESMSPEQLETIATGDDIHKDQLDPRTSSEIVKMHKSLKKRQRQETFCLQCLDSLQNRETPITPPILDSGDLIRRIPQDAQVFHVIDALDFPMSLSQDVIQKLGDSVQFVVNRSDLLLSHQNQVPRFHDYAMSEVFSHLGIPSSRVHVASAKTGWGLGKLSELFGKQNVLIGKTVTGKTALFNALSGGSYNTASWPVPFKTQQFMERTTVSKYGSKIIVDTPSLPEELNDGKGNFALVKPKIMRKAIQGIRAIDKKGMYTQGPAIAVPGQTLTIGGIVGISLPKTQPGNSIHAWPIIGGYTSPMGRGLSSLERITDINKSLEKNHKGWSMVRDDSDELYQDRGVVPIAELEASQTTMPSTILVRGLGMIQARLFGKYPDAYRMRVYGLQGLEIGFRGQVLPWIIKRKSKRDSGVIRPELPSEMR